MRHVRYLLLLALLALPAAYSRAQESNGADLVPVDQDSYVYSTPPVCPYGFYPYAPYACAPEGYWGPDWFVDGIFIGCGPWYHFYYTHGSYWQGFYNRYYRPPAFGTPAPRVPGFRGRNEPGAGRGFRGDAPRIVGGRGPGGGNSGFAGGRPFHGGDPGFRRGRDIRGGNPAFPGRGSNGGNLPYSGDRVRGGSEIRGGGEIAHTGGFQGGGEPHGGGGFAAGGGGSHPGGGGIQSGGGASHGGESRGGGGRR